jgi:hypothetical protein
LGNFGAMVISSGGVLTIPSSSFDFQAAIRVQVGRIEIGDTKAVLTGTGQLVLDGGSMIYTGKDGGQGRFVLNANGQLMGSVSDTSLGEAYISNMLVQLNNSGSSFVVNSGRLVVIANTTFIGVGYIILYGNE